MTIQLLHTFNGYAPGIYSSMGPTEEARLVSLGLARYYTAGMDGDNPVFSNSEQRSIRGVVSEGGNLPAARLVGSKLEQPAAIARPVSTWGKLACRFGSGQWTASVGTPTLTQGYTGWDGAGNKSGITSRTGMPDMLKMVTTPSTSQQIQLGTFATNMLTKTLAGKFGLWVYIENALPSAISFELSTTGGVTNGLYVSFTSQQLRLGWNFVKFVMRDPTAYVDGSGTTEYHPYGVAASNYGTGATTNIKDSDCGFLTITTTSTANAATLYFDSIWTGFACQPQVVLGCDGGLNTEAIAVPIFQANSWIGYHAYPIRVGSKMVITDPISTAGPGTALQQRMYGYGWDVINHSANHTTNGTMTLESEIVYELETAKAWQLSLDLTRGVEFYASPQSSTSALAEKVIEGLGYKLQRHAKHWNTSVTPWGVDNMNAIGSIDMGNTLGGAYTVTTSGASSNVDGWQIYSKLQIALDVIEAYGDTLFAFWHGVTTSGDTGTGENLTGDDLLLTASAFTKFCADLRARELAGRFTVCKGMTGFYYGGNL